MSESKRSPLRVLLLIGTIGLRSALSAPLEAETIKIGGTGGALGTMQVLAEAFKKSHPDTKIMLCLVLAVEVVERPYWAEP